MIDSKNDRNRAIQRVLWLEMALNLLVATGKCVYGLWSGSLVITADAIHSFVDAGANVVGIAALRYAAAPPDREHPYGHHKVEIVAATVLGAVIALSGIQFGWDAIAALIYGKASPATSPVGFAVIGVTWAINMFVAAYEHRRAKQLASAYLQADAAHTATDVLVTAAVLAAYTGTHYGMAWTDPVGALVVVAVIAYVAWRVITSNLPILLDRAALDIDQVRDVAMSVAGVTDCHRVRSRGSNRAVHVDLHVQMDGSLSLNEAHALSHRVEDALRAAVPDIADVTIHIEPADDPPERL